MSYADVTKLQASEKKEAVHLRAHLKGGGTFEAHISEMKALEQARWLIYELEKFSGHGQSLTVGETHLQLTETVALDAAIDLLCAVKLLRAKMLVKTAKATRKTKVTTEENGDASFFSKKRTKHDHNKNKRMNI